ncbi:DUF2062 domain-containing protein [Oceanisphaera ostreae]|uniref:DUF2062 domain-containing protein n=2 Tax=Oceanisphaera ostreae TaxID=914151 RepID=A0ABW3KHW2_9GAMM
MVRRWIRSKMPSQATLREHKLLRLFGERWLDPDYWSYNRRSVAIAIACGLFAAWLPLPLHSLIAIGLALLLRGYLPLAIAMVWVNNPLTIAPMFYVAYQLGVRLLGQPALEFSYSLEHDFASIIWPLLTGALLLGLASSLLGWLLTHLYWRCKIQRAWKARQR